MDKHGIPINCISVGNQAKPTDYFFPAATKKYLFLFDPFLYKTGSIFILSNFFRPGVYDSDYIV